MTHQTDKKPGETTPQAEELAEPMRTALELLHRTNDFLELCVSQTDLALDSEDPEELIDALRTIRDRAHLMADRSRDARERLDLEGDPKRDVGRRSA